MTIIDEFAPDAAAGARAAVAAWLRELYPGSDPPWVAPLRPDLLAEQLLATCAQLSELVLAGHASITMPEQAEQILTELTRAGTRPPVHGALDLLLHSHLPDLLTAAIAAPAGRLPDLLDHAVQLAPQPAQAARLAAQMPEHSVQLAALAATLTSQQVSQYRADALSGEPDAVNRLAESLTNLSRRLAALGRREEALAASQEAVTIRRGPAAPRPDAFRPHLAASLHCPWPPTWLRWGGGRRRWPRSRKPSPSAGSWPPDGPINTAPSWSSRCELLPGLRAAEASATHPRRAVGVITVRYHLFWPSPFVRPARRHRVTTRNSPGPRSANCSAPPPPPRHAATGTNHDQLDNDHRHNADERTCRLVGLRSTFGDIAIVRAKSRHPPAWPFPGRFPAHNRPNRVQAQLRSSVREPR